jgi:hypothetical protein
MHRNLQFSTIEHSLSITDASEIEIPIISDGTPFEEYIFSKEHLLYGRQTNEAVLRYIKNANITSVSHSFNKNVKINSKTYFSQYSETLILTGRIYKFGKDIELKVNNVGTANLSYKLTGTVNEQIKVLTFFLDMIKAGTVYIGDRELGINADEIEEDFINNIQISLEYLRDIVQP